MIIDVPIEAFEDRYSTQWQEWFKSEYERLSIDWLRVAPHLQLTDVVETGAWLDAHGSNFYKMSQLQELIDLLYRNLIKDGDVIFFHDLWFPGIEALAYIRSASGVKFKIAGCLHAGTWDKHDYLNSIDSGWARPFEALMFNVVDMIFVATKYHKELIEHRLIELGLYVEETVVYTTGFPIYPDDFVRYDLYEKCNMKQIVFPHRLDPEKNHQQFVQLQNMLEGSDYTFVTTREVCGTKEEYYACLATAGIAVSFADQETWGIAMQEALFSGCVPLVPDRLSYREMYSSILKFRDVKDLANKLHAMEKSLALKAAYAMQRQQTYKTLKAHGFAAIRNMMVLLEEIENV